MLRKLAGLLAGAMLWSACGGAPVPHSQLSAAKAAVAAAEVGGAQDDPQASLHLKKANDKIKAAQAGIEEGDNQTATYQLMEAEVDAELALTLAQEQQARAKAARAHKEIQELKARISGQ